MIPIKFLESLKLRVPIALIRDKEIGGGTKLVTMIEWFYSVAADLAGGCKRLPNKTEIAEFLGECRQTVSKKQKQHGYKTYSIARDGKILKRDKNKVEIPAVVAMNGGLDVYERLILIDIMAYRHEKINDVPMKQIGSDLGIDRVYVNRYIKSLVEREVLHKWLSPITNAGIISNCYEILDEPLRQLCIEQLRKRRMKIAIKIQKKC